MAVDLCIVYVRVSVQLVTHDQVLQVSCVQAKQQRTKDRALRNAIQDVFTF